MTYEAQVRMSRWRAAWHVLRRGGISCDNAVRLMIVEGNALVSVKAGSSNAETIQLAKNDYLTINVVLKPE